MSLFGFEDRHPVEYSTGDFAQALTGSDLKASGDRLFISFSPQLESLGEVRRVLREAADRVGLPEPRVFDLQVAVCEACANAIEHGRPGRDLELTIRLHPDRLEVNIFSDTEFQTHPLAQTERHEHRGMGLPLMAALADHLALYSTGEGGTLVTLTFYLAADDKIDFPVPPNQLEVRQENVLLSAILDAAPLSIFALDSELCLRWANPRFHQTREEPYRSGSVIGLPIEQLVPGIRLDRLRAVVESGQGYSGERRFETTTGEVRFSRFQVMPLRSPGSQSPYELLIIAQDITELVTERTHAEEERDRLSSVLEALTEGVVIADPHANVLHMNQEALRIHGLKSIEQIRRGPADWSEFQVYTLEGELVPLEEWPLMRVTRGETFRDCEVELSNRASGASRFVSYGGALIPGPDGDPLFTVLSVRDVTERVLSRQSLKWELKSTGLLKEVASAAASSIELPEVSRAVLEVVGDRLDASLGSLYHLDEGAGVLRHLALFGYPPGVLPLLDEVAFDERSHLGRALLDSGTSRGRDLPRSAVRDISTVLPGAEGDHWVVVPLKVTGRTIGGLVLSPPEGARFSDDEISLLEVVADQLGVAIENARLYESHRRISEELQEALLLVPVEIEGLSIGHLYRSATEEASVGGDFYDLVQTEADRVAVLIGDVSGHGVEAARAASLARDTIRAYAHLQMAPDEVLRLANRALLRRLPQGIFISAFYAQLDLSSGDLVYATAGHPPPLVRGREGIRILEHGFMPLSVLDEPSYRSQRVGLKRGDVLLLYTDGVTESRQNGGFFGEERLQELTRSTDAKAGELPELIFREVIEFTGGRLRDDLAILSLSLA